MAKQILKLVLTLFFLIGCTSNALTQNEVKQKRVDKRVEKIRADFKQLLIKNPNYFGNVTVKELAQKYSVIEQMSSNVKYEKLVCVGLYPESNLLEAIIEVKLPYGFKGQLCDKGSKEYVAFYIDYNDGSGFVSVGAPAEVNVHDISYIDGSHLYYAVRKPFIPLKYTECDTPQIVQVRAILSWEDLPTGPGYDPPWGNVVNAWVQIKPKDDGLFVDVIPGLEYDFPEMFEIYNPWLQPKKKPMMPDLPTEKYMILGNKEKLQKLIERSIEAEKRIRQEGKLEENRLEFKNRIKKNPNYYGSISTSKDINKIIEAVYQLPDKTQKYVLSQIAINPDWLMPVETLQYNTSYEELKCAGLYPEEDLLEAVIEVKQPYGFMGDLCTLGSKEYVAFYIDWGSGYQHEATAVVNVHDIPQVNEKHLFYAVRAKITDIESKLKACSTENIVKVKAVLSWNTDPTPYGHSWPQPWGNTIVRDMQIRPQDGLSIIADIEIVNLIHANDISQSGSNEGLAIKLDGSNNTVPTIYDRPFGGQIACWGNINIPGAAYYRFLYSDNNGLTWQKITSTRRARGPFGTTIPRSPDDEGWFSKNIYETDVGYYSLTALVHWNSAGKNGNYKIRLELADAAKIPLAGQTDDVSILLDNTALELYIFGGTPSPLPAKGVTVKDAGGLYKKCATFIGKESIRIFGNFGDDYFLQFGLKVFGGNIAAGGYPINIVNNGRYDSGLSGIGSQGIIGAADWTPGQEMYVLDLCSIPQSAGKVKCAYGIELTISDRSIVGRVGGYTFSISHHRQDAFVTFNWDPAGCSTP